MFHQPETSQQQADRLLAEYQTARNRQRASRMVLELSDDPAPEPRFWRRALDAICFGHARLIADAALMTFILFSAVAVTLFAGVMFGESEPPVSAAIAVDRPAVAIPPVDRRANGEAGQ